MKVLVVDDEERIRDVIYQYLSREGYTVEFSSDGKEALGKLNSIS